VEGTKLYNKSLLNAFTTHIASFDDLDLLAKPVTCRRLPNLKRPQCRFVERYLLGGARGEAGATHLTVARAELQQKQKTARLQMSPVILAPPAARHPAERVVSTPRKGKYCIGGTALSGTLRSMPPYQFNVGVNIEIDPQQS
jgi:hypothetical protein